jgi:hypothetical protein
MLRECAGTEDSRNLATGIRTVAKFRGNFAVSTYFSEMSKYSVSRLDKIQIRANNRLPLQSF